MISYVDLHCDALTEIFKMDGNLSLEEQPELHVDLKRLRKSGAIGQFFAVWMPDKPMERSDWEYIEWVYSIFQHSLSDTFRLARSAQELKQNIQERILSGILSLEDCRVVRHVDDLSRLYSMGFRSYGFVWNHANGLAFPHSANPTEMAKGLSTLGKEAVEWLNDHGGIVDVSHLSDGGFWDVAEIATKPFIATHSNARALRNHSRNLTDDMIRRIAQGGGVIGLNFHPPFLSEDAKRNRLEDHIAHLNHMKKVGGEDVVAIGSDFDGISGELAIKDSSEMPILFEELSREGWSARQIEKVAKDNILRVIEDVW